jgi:penicillin-binding protein 2
VERNLGKHEEWAETILPADAEAEAPESDTSRRPALWLGLGMVAVLGLLIARLFLLQVSGGSVNLALANGNRVRERVERAPRGVIYDRNQQPLARNQASYDVTVVPQLLPDSKAARQAEYKLLGSILGMAPADVATKVETCTSSKDPEVCLADGSPKLVAAGVERTQALLADQATDQLPGFALDVNPIREYVDGGLLSVVLGYTGRITAEEKQDNPDYGLTDLIGKLGIEKQYEALLRGVNGGERAEVDATGRPLRVLENVDPVPGDNLVLSIDMSLEQKMAEVIKKQMDLSKATRAAGVAINPQTGEILAAVSLPTYDNNLFSRGISQADYQKLLGDPAQPLFNKAISGAYPSGSIIKPLVASAALQEHIITPSTTITDTGKLEVTNQYNSSIKYVFQGWEHSGLGVMNVFSAIARSSDIFFYTVAGGFTNFTHYLGVDKLTKYYQLFGLGAKTGVDLPSETAGRVPTPDWKKKATGESWYTGDTYNISVGQGDILVSPLQMAAAIAAVANGGTLYQPHFLLKAVDTKGKVVQEVKPQVIRQGFISPANLEIVRQGMRQTVTDTNGTACCKMEQEVPVAVAGKTGSAETDPGNNVPPHSWFEAFAPYDNPQIVTVILLEKAGEGAEYAVPATRELLAWYFKEGAGSKH